MIGERSDFGAHMKQLREARGVTLRRIADSTKISVVALEALESNDIARLPGGNFSRAVVRAYAQEVGADPEQAVQEFMTRFPDESVVVGNPHVSHHDLATKEVRHVGRWVAVGAAVAVPAAIVVWLLLAR